MRPKNKKYQLNSINCHFCILVRSAWKREFFLSFTCVYVFFRYFGPMSKTSFNGEELFFLILRTTAMFCFYFSHFLYVSHSSSFIVYDAVYINLVSRLDKVWKFFFGNRRKEMERVRKIKKKNLHLDEFSMGVPWIIKDKKITFNLVRLHFCKDLFVVRRFLVGLMLKCWFDCVVLWHLWEFWDTIGRGDHNWQHDTKTDCMRPKLTANVHNWQHVR